MLSDPAPRPPRCYDPTLAPYRDELGVHVHDYATVRALLRDPVRVTSDVTEMLTPAQREHIHPVSAFVWATDRRTLSGCPGRHAVLRTAMAPWFTASAATARQDAAAARCARIADALTGGPFDLYHDYAVPAVIDYMADFLGIEPADVRYSVGDQLAAGDMFETWPMLAGPEMDERFRALMARPRLSGVAAEARAMVADGTLGEREAWGVVYAISVSSVATAAAVTLAVGLAVEHGLWPELAETAVARRAIEEAVRLGSPFPQASRFAREPLTLGGLSVEPGEQVLMWLTAANRDLPGPHAAPLDAFDPGRDNAGHLGWGSGYHLCAGVHHARGIAASAVATLARRCPDLRVDGVWKRFVGIDDGYTTAPVVA